MKKVQVIPATLQNYTEKPIHSQKREGSPGMHAFQPTGMNSLQVMKHRLTIIQII